MNGLKELEKIKNSYREQKKKLVNDPFIHLHEHIWFMAVEKELKALKIVNEKNVNVGMLKRSESASSYNYKMDERRDKCKPLTEDEFNFLKEAFK